VQVKELTVPDGLLVALEKRRCKYTALNFLYQGIWTDIDTFIGVFGDGPNASYEWFLWKDGVLETSDCGYGSEYAALRDAVLETQKGARRSKEDQECPNLLL